MCGSSTTVVRHDNLPARSKKSGKQVAKERAKWAKKTARDQKKRR